MTGLKDKEKQIKYYTKMPMICMQKTTKTKLITTREEEEWNGNVIL